jgi:drug/metabolite transporter (DMT)-like permease
MTLQEAARQSRAPELAYPTALLLLYGALAGATFTLAKVALSAGVKPLGYAAWQTAGAGLLMAAVALARGQPIPRTPAALAFYAVCGLIGVAMPSIAMFSALAHISAGTMAIIASTVPLFTFALAALLGSEPATTRRLLGLLSGLAGALVILGPRAALPGFNELGWTCLGFLAPLGYAAGSVYAGWRRPADASPVVLTVGMLVFAGGALTGLAVLRGEAYWPQQLGLAELTIAAQVLVSGFGYLLFFEIIRAAGPVFFSQTAYVVACAGMAWPWLLFGDRVDGALAIAAGLILAGVALARPPARKAAAK